jgi:hypothetical protein
MGRDRFPSSKERSAFARYDGGAAAHRPVSTLGFRAGVTAIELALAVTAALIIATHLIR